MFFLNSTTQQFKKGLKLADCARLCFIYSTTQQFKKGLKPLSAQAQKLPCMRELLPNIWAIIFNDGTFSLYPLG